MTDSLNGYTMYFNEGCHIIYAPDGGVYCKLDWVGVGRAQDILNTLNRQLTKSPETVSKDAVSNGGDTSLIQAIRIYLAEHSNIISSAALDSIIYQHTADIMGGVEANEVKSSTASSANGSKVDNLAPLAKSSLIALLEKEIGQHIDLEPELKDWYRNGLRKAISLAKQSEVQVSHNVTGISIAHDPALSVGEVYLTDGYGKPLFIVKLAPQYSAIVEKSNG